MYTKYFGLKILPFENVPDPMFFFDQGDHARIRKRITDSLKAERGLMVITGPIGSGKTTLSQMLKSDLSHNIKLIWMAVPPGNSVDLFLFIAQEFGLNPSTSERVFVIRDIRDALLKINSEGSKCLVIVDESHLMSDDTLNGIRLLNNLEEGSTKLIQILLLGQEELMETINRPEMESFKQRIATLEIIGKMNAEKRYLYILHRIQVAGGHPSIFADSGWEALDLALGSEGTPRIINSLCDRSLSVAFEREKTKVDVYDVFEASQGMGLRSDIFHYIVDLKNIERKKQATSIGKNSSIKEPETISKGPIHSLIGDPDESDKNVQSTIHQTTQEGSEISFSKSNIANKSLKMPVIFLSLSIVALILSIFFYCQKSGSLELLTCLQDLISF